MTLLLALSIIVPAAASDEIQDDAVACSTGVLKDEEFGALYLDVTIEEFNAMGFEFGDSVDVELSNGFKLEDIPYYSGYYVPAGEPLVCGYPGYPHVAVAYNYGDPMWDVSGADDQTTAQVTVREKGKYAATQELFQHTYLDEQQEGETDECYANFRMLKGGNLKEGLIFRSASPCDNTHNRAECSDDLAEKTGIRCVLNLADSREELEDYRAQESYCSDYYDSLDADGNVLLLNLAANYMAEDFIKVLSEGMYEMVQHEGPYLIHCLEGKDRTGFVCVLILCLAEAEPQEIIDDYMITYQNYYNITKETDPDCYDAVTEIACSFLEFLTGTEDVMSLTADDLVKGAEEYLRNGGLNDEQIAKIRDALCENVMEAAA